MGSCAFARHYLRNRCYFLFLRVLRCFSSPGSLLALRGDAVARAGLPHSEIRASTGICPYARLFAACHVLLRLREPRHPSCALLSFPFSFKGNSPFYLLFFFFSIEVKNQRSRISAAVSHSLSATRGLPRCGGLSLCRQAYCLAHLRSLLASCVLYCLCCSCSLSFSTSPGALPPPAGKKTCFSFQYVNVLFFQVVPGRVELPTSTLSV